MAYLPGMEIQSLGEGAWLAVGKTLAANSTILRVGQDALLIDTTGSREDARDLKALIEKELRLTVRKIISTHYFSDHLAGHALFPNAEIIAHKYFLATFAAEENRTDEEKNFFVPPHVLFEKSAPLTWGRFSLDIFPNPGATPCMLNIDIPELDLVHGGDTAVGAMVFLPYAKASALRLALQALGERNRGRLILSHGSVFPRGTITEAAAYLENLRQTFSVASDPTLEKCWASRGVPGRWDYDYHARNLATLRRSPGFFDR